VRAGCRCAHPGYARHACRDNDRRAFCASGTRNVLKPAISGNHSAASREASVRTAAGTSPLISRSIAGASGAGLSELLAASRPVPITRDEIDHSRRFHDLLLNCSGGRSGSTLNVA
jgi:hypothetical protein